MRFATTNILQDFQKKMPEKCSIGSAIQIFVVAGILLWTYNSYTRENGFKIWSIQHDYLGVQLRIGRNTTSQDLKTLFSWISIPPVSNQTVKILETIAKHSCYFSNTTTIKIPGLENGQTVELSAGKIHHFTILAYDEAGNQRCSGGDYLETDLSGDSWKSRPPVEDLGNGSYSMLLQVHPDYIGDYVFRVVLLFRNFEGLILGSEKMGVMQELLNVPIKFRQDQELAKPLQALQACGKKDFQLDKWSGRWTRHGRNDSCKVDNSGRHRCLKPDFPCPYPWCEGPLGSLESNGWVYSSHCSFRIFTGDSAWNCLQNRWFFFWGDSNHGDSIRNLLNFVLGIWDVDALPRRFDRNFTNPGNPSQTIRITNIFNGHHVEDQNAEGLESLDHEEFRNLLRSYFTGPSLPDVMVMNSGIHDGAHWRNFTAFSNAAEFAAEFWNQLLKNSTGKPPEFIFRNTVVAAGVQRTRSFNPHRMEYINAILLEKFREKGLVSSMIDNFDMTYPWHYNNDYSDGVHYGRKPAPQNGHWYFVDLMLLHVILNIVCL